MDVTSGGSNPDDHVGEDVRLEAPTTTYQGRRGHGSGQQRGKYFRVSQQGVQRGSLGHGGSARSLTSYSRTPEQCSAEAVQLMLPKVKLPPATCDVG